MYCTYYPRPLPLTKIGHGLHWMKWERMPGVTVRMTGQGLRVIDTMNWNVTGHFLIIYSTFVFCV